MPLLWPTLCFQSVSLSTSASLTAERAGTVSPVLRPGTGCRWSSGFQMIEAEWLAFEILTLGVSWLRSTYLVVQSIIMTMAILDSWE